MSEKDNDPRKQPFNEDELIRAQVYDGEVRISLQTYHDLISSATKQEKSAEKYDEAIDAVSRYMTFLRSRDDVDFPSIMNDFNKENPDLTMYVDDNGKVRFNLNLTS